MSQQSRKTFIGTILSVTQTKIVLTSNANGGEPIALAAGAVVLEQARSLIGRTVRYTAELDASTSELTRPQFVIGSEYGLRAQVVMRDVLDTPAEDVEAFMDHLHAKWSA